PQSLAPVVRHARLREHRQGAPLPRAAAGGDSMNKVKLTMMMSFDGYVAGPDQSREEPLSRGGEALHEWLFGTRAFHEVQKSGGGTPGPDNEIARGILENVGATIRGRNMFGPVRGPWPDESWKGWWGSNPPYHAPVFVLTHHARAPLPMEG